MIEKLIAIVGETLNIQKERVQVETRQEDLEEWDSLTHIQLIGEIEENFNTKIPIEEIANIKTVGDFLKYIKE